MAPLPDYNQLKSVISRHWDAGYPASSLHNKDIIELCTAAAEEQNLSLDEFLLRKATGSWSKWIDKVRNRQDDPENKQLKTNEIGDGTEEQKIGDRRLQLFVNSGLINLLDVQDLSTYQHLNEVAESIGVKSWQLTEYIETLRDELGILPLHYEQNKQIVEDQQFKAAALIPTTNEVETTIDNTTFDPSQSPETHAQSSKKSYLIPALLSGIGLLLIILIAVISGPKRYHHQD